MRQLRIRQDAEQVGDDGRSQRDDDLLGTLPDLIVQRVELATSRRSILALATPPTAASAPGGIERGKSAFLRTVVGIRQDAEQEANRARRSRSEFGEGPGGRCPNGRGRVSEPIRQSRDRGRHMGGESGQECAAAARTSRAGIVQSRHQDGARGRMMGECCTGYDDSGHRPAPVVRLAKGVPRFGELRGDHGPDAGIGNLRPGQEPIDHHRGREVLPRDIPCRRELHIELIVLELFEERGREARSGGGNTRGSTPRGPAGRGNPGRETTARERRARAVSRSAWR